MTQARVIVTERGGVDLADEWVESDPVVDELLVKGVVTTSTVLTFEDSTNGSVTLTDTLKDEIAKVSANDTVAGFLNGKLVAGAGITLTEVGDGGNETLSISSPGTGTDELVGVTANDTTPGYLFDKIIGTSGKIVVTEVNDAGDEDFQINVGADIFDHVTDDTDDITEGATNLFFTDERVDDRVNDLLLEGTNISFVYDDSGGSFTINVDATADTKEVKVSANDTTPAFLLAKIVAGANITVTELGDGGNETLSIAAATPVDEKARVSSNDGTTDFLVNKITGGTGIDATEVNDGGAETLDIALNASIEDLNDVVFDSFGPASGDLLEWDGANWVPITPGDIATVNTYSYNGGYKDVGNSATKGALWGTQQSTAGIGVLSDGEITGISCAITAARTAGTFEVMLVLNGISQNGAGETFFIDATNTQNFQLVFATPIVVSQGDILSMQGISTTFSPSSADPTMAFWGRDT